MAADIKNYLKEKEKRQKNQDDYKKKIRKHKLTIVYFYCEGTKQKMTGYSRRPQAGISIPRT